MLYKELVQTLKIKLISDHEQGPGGRAIWSSIQKAVRVSAVNTKTHQRVPIEQLSYEDIYKNDPKDPENIYRLVAETCDGIWSFGDPDVGRCGLGDNLIFTHSEEKGKWD